MCGQQFQSERIHFGDGDQGTAFFIDRVWQSLRAVTGNGLEGVVIKGRASLQSASADLQNSALPSVSSCPSAIPLADGMV
jgi:hypothetical protein